MLQGLERNVGTVEVHVRSDLEEVKDKDLSRRHDNVMVLESAVRSVTRPLPKADDTLYTELGEQH